jgi:ubiquinone biosynthesis protein UbiJ
MFLSTINKILASNQGSCLLLRKYNGKSFVINIAGLINFSANITSDGLLVHRNDPDYTDTSIKINSTIAGTLLENNHPEMLKHITITGDKSFGLELLKILSNLEITEALMHNQSVSLSFVLSILGKFITIIKNNLQLITRNTAQSIIEYLQYETTDIVGRHEIEQFCTSVDILKERADRLIKRFNLLDSTQK